MDEYVRAYLKLWELDELIPRFKDEEINEKAFKCLTEDIIRELIPKLGKRAIFQRAYQEFRDGLANDTQQSDGVLPDESADESVTEPQLENQEDEQQSENHIKPSVDIKIEFTNDNIHVVEVLEHIPTPQQVAESSNVSAPNKGHTPFTLVSIAPLDELSEQDYKTATDLRALLSSCLDGRLHAKTFLTRSNRAVLSREIVKFLFNKNGGILSNEVLHSWARAVEVVFSTEITALYFRQSEDGSTCSGMLFDSYQEMKSLRDEQQVNS
ncbi:uncharacterized protein LOC131438754 [Malaya genurostris]|uniref:uncharacterized protein LOC131438754 n=1 Tax=Malaya genurostris TaxID=325434 RepID=UPI0026F398E4|nr:uncharacterized protein LOC131438754 [Malaya genurostris]XP_058464979.1 uncharacterized protein LOC131438754 [Malaya genurostris]